MFRFVFVDVLDKCCATVVSTTLSAAKLLFFFAIYGYVDAMLKYYCIPDFARHLLMHTLFQHLGDKANKLQRCYYLELAYGKS